ncbi:ATP-binding protein [Emcibacter sp.]|uniref:ATP-binding protein n=1 Tax=Emcibacter sp. TaxID=1979954 RepID=UPI003A946F19
MEVTSQMTLIIIDNAGLNEKEMGALFSSQNIGSLHTKTATETFNKLLEITSSRKDPEHAILLSDEVLQQDGTELVRDLNANKSLRDLPLIVIVEHEENYENLRQKYSGSIYWLHKPFKAVSLHSLVESAMEDLRQRRSLRQEIESRESVIGYIQKGTFRIKNFLQAEKVATMLSLSCPEPDRIAFGLFELLANAIEHGNLGISFEEKRKLLEHGTMQKEVLQRLGEPAYRDRYVEVEFELKDNEVVFQITDQGNGFDVDSFISAKIEPSSLPLGRGIALARETSFDTLEYLGKGNRVRATALF